MGNDSSWQTLSALYFHNTLSCVIFTFVSQMPDVSDLGHLTVTLDIPSHYFLCHSVCVKMFTSQYWQIKIRKSVAVAIVMIL